MRWFIHKHSEWNFDVTELPVRTQLVAEIYEPFNIEMILLL